MKACMVGSQETKEKVGLIVEQAVLVEEKVQTKAGNILLVAQQWLNASQQAKDL